ncbi:MAG: GyrI-like domain-containing protein, partial [Firmicutes bacterium]|nr:GyrI-like domain-containing protein [Bacillota bacterium]
NLLSVRKMVEKDEFPSQYKENFGYLMKKVEEENLTMTSSPMVLFHDEEFSPFGLDTEFAIPVKEQRKETRIYHPGTCLKTVLHGPYTNLPSIYTKQIEYAETHGYENDGPLYEVYVTDPSQVKSKEELVTEIYYPVIKRRN